MWDNTPLICACQYRHVDVALELIAAGADVCAVNEKGNTALLHASLEGLVTVVTALLARGAVVDVAPSLIYNSVTDSNQMLTPVTAATQNEHSDVLASLTLAVASAPRAAPTSPASAEEIQAPSPVHNSHAGTDQVAQLFAEATQPV